VLRLNRIFQIPHTNGCHDLPTEVQVLRHFSHHPETLLCCHDLPTEVQVLRQRELPRLLHDECPVTTSPRRYRCCDHSDPVATAFVEAMIKGHDLPTEVQVLRPAGGDLIVFDTKVTTSPRRYRCCDSLLRSPPHRHLSLVTTSPRRYRCCDLTL